MKRKVVLVGAGKTAMMFHFYLTHDSPHEVAAFAVDRDYIREESLCRLPVVPFEDVETIYPPAEYKMLIAMSFSRANRNRADKYLQAKTKGYELINYISSKSVTWPGLVVGDNTIICEGSVINPFVRIGNNVIVAGSFIGHHSVIQDHCFLAANAVVLGETTVEPYCVLGANSTILDNVTVARECIVGAGVTIGRSTVEQSVYITRPAELAPRSSSALSALCTWPRGGAKVTSPAMKA